MSVPSHLGRYQPVEPADDRQLHGMKAALYHKECTVVLRKSDLARLGDWAERAVLNLADDLYGKRQEG